MSAGEDVKKREPSCAVGGIADWCTNCGNSMECPQKINNRIALRPSDSTSGNISKGI